MDKPVFSQSGTSSEILAKLAQRDIAKIPRERWLEIRAWYRANISEEEFLLTLKEDEVDIVESTRMYDFVLRRRGLCLASNGELKRAEEG